jgi:hypothetical protein
MSSALKIATPASSWCVNICRDGYFYWAGEAYLCMLCAHRIATENKKKSIERNLEANLF